MPVQEGESINPGEIEQSARQRAGQYAQAGHGGVMEAIIMAK